MIFWLEILEGATIPPAVNQVRPDPSLLVQAQVEFAPIIATDQDRFEL